MPPSAAWPVTAWWSPRRPSRAPRPDRKRYVITEQGATEVEAWLTEPVEAEPHLQTVLFVKVVLALMLGRSAERCLDTQRRSHLQRMRELTELKQTGSLVDALLADHGLFHLEAEPPVDRHHRGAAVFAGGLVRP